MTSDETTAAEVTVAITAPPSEESIICGTDSRQLYTDALSVVDIHRSDDEMMLLLPMIELFVFGTTVGTYGDNVIWLEDIKYDRLIIAS